MQDIHNSRFCRGKEFLTPYYIFFYLGFQMIHALVDSNRFQGSVTRSLLQSTCQSFRTTKLEPLVFLAFVIFKKTCDFLMPGLSTYDVRLSNYTFWGCCHASIHCLSIASTRIHRSHEAHDEGIACDKSTSAGKFLSHESTLLSGCAMMLIVADVSFQGMRRAISTCLHCIDKDCK